MEEMVYLNNFPRENALKGQKFDGASDLEAELLERGIIGNRCKLEEEGYYEKNKLSHPTIEALEARIKELENEERNDSDEELALELKAVKAENEKLFVAGEDMTKQIEELVAMVKESISLPKGQEPTGYEKYKG